MLLLGHEIQKTFIHTFIPTGNILREISVLFSCAMTTETAFAKCLYLFAWFSFDKYGGPQFLRNIFLLYNCCNSKLSYLGKKTFSLQPSYRLFVPNCQVIKQYSSIFLERRYTKGMERHQFTNTEIMYIADTFVLWPS